MSDFSLQWCYCAIQDLARNVTVSITDTHHSHEVLPGEKPLFDWSQFYSVPGPPCDTEENVQVAWLPKEINQSKKNPNKKKPTPQSIKEKEEIKNVNPEILSCILMLEPEHHESWLSLYYIVSKMEI